MVSGFDFPFHPMMNGKKRECLARTEGFLALKTWWNDGGLTCKLWFFLWRRLQSQKMPGLKMGNCPYLSNC